MQYPQIDPLAFSIGPLQVHWYGLMYLFGFIAAWWLGSLQAQRTDNPFNPDKVSDLVFYGGLGAVLGGRIGYALFYRPDSLLADPLVLVRLWEGGMSFHGGLLGVILACCLYGRKHHFSFIQVTDFIAPLAPFGLGLGRLGNFINTELPGRLTDLAWGLHYPCHSVYLLNAECGTLGDYESVARHPSALYQAFAEGLLLLALMLWFTRTPRPTGFASALFLVGYGAVRLVTENFRSPDAHIGLLFFDLTLGQLLSLPLLLAGLIWLVAIKKQSSPKVHGH